MPKELLGRLIKSALEQAGYQSINSAAKACGVDDRWLGQLYRGEVSPSIDSLERIFNAIGWEVAVSFFPAGGEKRRRKKKPVE